MASAADEYRENRGRWLQEKNELLSRCMQVQALVTQAQGTLRKREKDFERLQNQYEKLLTKETNKSNKEKGLAVSGIMITKPLPKQISQTRPQLKDAELQLQQQRIQTLEVRTDQRYDGRCGYSAMDVAG